MTRPIDARQLAEMFARAAEIKVSRTGEGRLSGRELLEGIFARARELQLAPAPRAQDEDTAPLAVRRDPPPPDAAPAQVARGWNEAADVRAAVPAPGTDPDDLVRTRFLDRESAVDEFRSSLEALFAGSDPDELLAVSDSTAGPVAAASSDERPVPSAPGVAVGGSVLFTQAAEAMFGVALEELEQLVLEAWERRMRGEPSPVVGPAAAPPSAAPVTSPPAPPAAVAPDVDGLLSGFAFEGGNPVPAAEVARRAREQSRAAPPPAARGGEPTPRALPRPAPRAAEPAAPAVAAFGGDPPRRRVEPPPTLAWGAPPRDAPAAAPRGDDHDPFARPGGVPAYAGPGASTLPDERAPIALPAGGVAFPRPGAPIDLLAHSTVHDESGPLPLPRADEGTIHDGGAPIPLPTAGTARPDATVHDDGAPIALPRAPDAFSPRRGDAFAPDPSSRQAAAPGRAAPAAFGWAPPPPGGPPGWQTGSGHPAAAPPQGGGPPGWQTGSGRHPTVPPGWRPPPSAPTGAPPAGAGWGSGAHALGPVPPVPPTAPPPGSAGPQPHVPAGWPFVDGPAPAPASGRHARPKPTSARHQRPSPPPPPRPKGPPSGEGFDPFAPSWWDERPSDDDVKL